VAESRRRVNRQNHLVGELKRAGREPSSSALAELAQSEAALAKCVAIRDQLRAELSALCQGSPASQQHHAPARTAASPVAQ
jgi:hypothetical protein